MTRALVAVMFASAVPAWASPPDADEVTGQVLDEGGKPIAGVKVLVHLGPGPVPEGRSRADGTFTVRGVPKGKHRYEVLHDSYAPKWGEVKTPGTLEVRLSRGASLRGDVVDENGRPVSTEIVAFSRDLTAQNKYGESDERGAFAFEGLHAAEYDVMARFDGDPAASARVTVRATQETVVHLKVNAGASISGKVVDAGGKPQRGVIHARSQKTGAEPDRMARLDAQGGFTLRGLRSGNSYFLSASTDGMKDAQEQKLVVAPATGVVVTVDMLNRVRGRLVDERGKAITRFFVNFAVQKSDDGSFELMPDELDRGVVLSATGYATKVLPLKGVALEADLGDIVLRDGRGVAVSVSDTQGRPLDGATAADNLTRDYDPMYGTRAMAPANRALTDASGRAQLEHLALDDASVWVSAPGYATVQAKVGREQSQVSVTLQLATTLSGKVSDAEGTVVSYGQVTAKREGERTRTCNISQLGKYELTDLPPGDWAIQAAEHATRFSRPLVVHLEPGAKLTRDLTFVVGVKNRITTLPPLAFDEYTLLQLVPGEHASIRSVDELTAAQRDRVTLFPSATRGVWETEQAEAGVTTLFVIRSNDEVVELRTGVATLPPNGGTTQVRLSEPVRLKKKQQH